MPSITSWNRLEPRSRQVDPELSLSARVHDSLWFLTRQWMFGEMRGEDAGSPVVARLRGRTFRLQAQRPRSRTVPWVPHDPGREPLACSIERDDEVASLWRRIEAGLEFERMLQMAELGHYAAAYRSQYPLPRPISDPLTDRLLAVLEVGVSDGQVSYRAPDGQALYLALLPYRRAAAGATAGLPLAPSIPDVTERALIGEISDQFIAWYEDLLDDGESRWDATKLEYEFSLQGQAAGTTDTVVLDALEHRGDDLDWPAFDLVSISEPASADTVSLVSATVPTPVTYFGAPADRWWEFEDPRADLSAVDAGPSDLARMLLLEFALTYGNDFFAIPFDLDVGQVAQITSLVVVDTFGESTLIRPVASGDSKWQMFTTTRLGGEPDGSLLLMPAILGPTIRGTTLEQVLLARDEAANLAWAIEQVIESGSGEPHRRSETAATRVRPPERRTVPLAYRLATSVPENWFPLTPSMVSGGVKLQLRRVAGARLEATWYGRTLRDLETVRVGEEMIPRSGAQVDTAYRYARWLDGSTHVWRARRTRVGRGESSSGLRFDVLDEGGAGR